MIEISPVFVQRPSSLKLIERRVSAPAICSPLETPEDSSLNDSDDETVQDNPVIYPQGNVGEEGEEFVDDFVDSIVSLKVN